MSHTVKMATEYGKRLKQAMAFAGINQKELVRRTGVAQSTVSSAINQGNGSSDTPKYAAACGVSALWLASGEGAIAQDQTGAVLPTPKTAPSLSPHAVALAQLFDKVPTDDRVRWAIVYQKASMVILDALQGTAANPAPSADPETAGAPLRSAPLTRKTH